MHYLADHQRCVIAAQQEQESQTCMACLCFPRASRAASLGIFRCPVLLSKTYFEAVNQRLPVVLTLRPPAAVIVSADPL